MPRKFEGQIEIAGSPEAVWKAIASDAGLQAWFAPEVKVTPGVGGEVWASWGPGMEGGSAIETWEPARHKRTARSRGGDKEPSAVDYHIEALEGGRTVLRVVHTGFGDDASYDNEYESTSHAWPLFLGLLKRYVETPHEVCRNITVMRMGEGSQQEAWKKVRESLQIDGERWHFDPFGNAGYEVKLGSRALLAIFCEGSVTFTALTVMCLLYDPKPGDEETGRQLAESVAASMG